MREPGPDSSDGDAPRTGRSGAWAARSIFVLLVGGAVAALALWAFDVNGGRTAASAGDGGRLSGGHAFEADAPSPVSEPSL